MAAGSITYQTNDQPSAGVHRVRARVEDGDVNVDFTMPRAAHMTMQVQGTFSSEVVTLQVSNDGTNFTAPATATTLGADGVKAFTRDAIGFRHYRLACAGGDATTDIVITVIGSSNGL